MYKDFFGLTVKPFHITPDPNFLFLSHDHQKAITCMEYGVLEDTGIILLTGEIGTGKTTLIRHMLTKFEENVQVATIYNTNVNSKQLYAQIAEAFGLTMTVKDKHAMLKQIQTELEQMQANALKPVVIMDDAQNLSLRTLEDVRLLSNLQKHDRMLVQLILVGQPELKEKLEDSAVASLVQRIGITYHISAFSREETDAYIAHRLRIAGGNPNTFQADALEMLFKITQGNPRTINIICDHAMVYGFADDIKTIDEGIIRQVLKDNPGLGSLEDPGQQLVESQGEQGPISTSEALQIANTPSKNAGPGNWQQRIESRLQTLEQLMAEYSRELRDVITSMFEKERQKNDNLMLKYARLETENQMLKQTLAQHDCQCQTPEAQPPFHPNLPGDA